MEDLSELMPDALLELQQLHQENGKLMSEISESQPSQIRLRNQKELEELQRISSRLWNQVSVARAKHTSLLRQQEEGYIRLVKELRALQGSTNQLVELISEDMLATKFCLPEPMELPTPEIPPGMKLVDCGVWVPFDSWSGSFAGVLSVPCGWGFGLTKEGHLIDTAWNAEKQNFHGLSRVHYTDGTIFIGGLNALRATGVRPTVGMFRSTLGYFELLENNLVKKKSQAEFEKADAIFEVYKSKMMKDEREFREMVPKAKVDFKKIQHYLAQDEEDLF